MPDIIQFDLPTQTAQMQQLVDAIDSGSGPGKMKFLKTGTAEVALVITLNKPCGTVNNGVLTLSGLPKASVFLIDAVLDAAVFTDSNDVVRSTGYTVAITGSDASVLVDNVSGLQGQTFELNNPGTITHG